jgi:cell division protein ZapA (FtsZ GTPase activity inhibitor)
MAQSIKVTILGNEYPLRSNDEELTRQLAADVDTQLRELQSKFPSQSTTTLSVLTALNYAEQDAQTKQQELTDLERVAGDLEALCTSLERALDA